MPLRAQRHNNLALNRRLTTLTSRAELLMVIQVTVKSLRIIPAIVFSHLSLGFLIVVMLIGMLSAAGYALEAGGAVSSGLGVEGGVLEGGGAVGAEEAGRVEEGG